VSTISGELQFNARTAVYLLGHFRVHRSLPVLLDAYKQQSKESQWIPIPRAFLFAIMDELVRSHPEQGLSAESLRYLESYRAVVKTLPRAGTALLPSWDADFNKLDYRHMFAKLPLPLESQPKVKVTIFAEWPKQYELANGYLLEHAGRRASFAGEYANSLKPTLQDYISIIERFSDATY